MDIQKQIQDTLSEHLKAYTEGDNEKAERLDKILEEKSIDWLTHQQSIISQQTVEIERLRLAMKDAYGGLVAIIYQSGGTIKLYDDTVINMPAIETQQIVNRYDPEERCAVLSLETVKGSKPNTTIQGVDNNA